jgi:hypothetical protein
VLFSTPSTAAATTSDDDDDDDGWRGLDDVPDPGYMRSPSAAPARAAQGEKIQYKATAYFTHKQWPHFRHLQTEANKGRPSKAHRTAAGSIRIRGVFRLHQFLGARFRASDVLGICLRTGLLSGRLPRPPDHPVRLLLALQSPFPRPAHVGEKPDDARAVPPAAFYEPGEGRRRRAVLAGDDGEGAGGRAAEAAVCLLAG